jgi:thymidylate kinase
MSRRGAFIVIEGLDRSGKSTQAALLRQTLQENGHNVVLIKFPGKFLGPCRLNSAHADSRQDNAYRSDDRLVPPLTIKSRRPHHSSPFLSQPVGAGVRFIHSHRKP